MLNTVSSYNFSKTDFLHPDLELLFGISMD